MEIAVGASLAAKGNMNVKSRQFKAKFVICGQTRLLKKFFIAVVSLSLVQYSIAHHWLRASNRGEVAYSDSTMPGDLLQSLRKQGFFALRTQDSAITLSGVRFVCFFKESGAARLYKPEDYIALQDSWLFDQLQTGYPFASYQCVPDSAVNSIIYITLDRQSGPLCLYDSICLNDLRLSGYFLKKTARLIPGLPYNEAEVQQFRSRMLAVDGFALSGKAIPSFYYGRFVLNPAIIRQKRDRLSALLGLATQVGQKPLVTGEADAAFYDLFGHGVSVYSRWRRFQARSQELFAGAELPYLLGTPFTTGLHLGLEKYDTVYTRFSRRAVFRFPASRQLRWSIGVERMGVTGLGIDTLYVKALRSLPQNAPSKATSYLASLEKVNLQTAVFPRQGWSFKVEAGIGSRIWLRDAAISSIVWKNSEGFFENIFDSLQRTGNLRQTTLKLRYSGAFHLPVARSWVFYFSAQGEEYKAPVINFSELSRWGGINSIRGFNEQRIFASSFHMANFELRFMAGQSGFIAPFVSGAVYRNATQLNMGYRSLYSLGLAGGLKTGAGIMKFAWAMGNEGLGFNLRDAKFHLGLSNVF
jgi:hypothetical protein